MELKENIQTSIEDAKQLYQKLILLVGRSGSGKTASLRSLSSAFDVPVINVNLEISTRLLDVAMEKRASVFPGLFRKLVMETVQGLLLMDNLEILFDPSLYQNPLSLLRNHARNRVLIAVPLCPYCTFKPAQEDAGPSVSMRLSQFEDDLDRLYDEWTHTLLTNLEDPITQERVELLTLEKKRHIQEFLKARVLPEVLSDEFVEAVREALSDLKKIPIKVSELKHALLKGGSPFNPGEMKSRLDNYLSRLTAGKDPNKVRIVLE